MDEIPLSRMLLGMGGIALGIFLIAATLFLLLSRGCSSNRETAEVSDGSLAIQVPANEEENEPPTSDETHANDVPEPGVSEEPVVEETEEETSVFQSEMGKLLSGEVEPESDRTPAAEETAAKPTVAPTSETSPEESQETEAKEPAAKENDVEALTFTRRSGGVEFEEDSLSQKAPAPNAPPDAARSEPEPEAQEAGAAPVLSVAIPRPEKEYLAEATAQALDVPLEGVTATERPLTAWLKFGSRLSGISIYADWKKLKELGVETTTPISLNLGKTTVREALDTALASRQLGLLPNKQGLKIADLDAVEIYRYSVGAGEDKTLETFDFSDLASSGPNDASRAKRGILELLDFIQTFVHPGTWERCGGFGRVVSNRGPSRIQIRQYPAMHQEIELFCDKLRHARKIPQRGLHAAGEEFPRGKQDGTALADAVATSLWERSKKACETPVQCDFGDGTTLRKALETICRAANVRLIIEEQAVAQVSVRDLIFDAKVPGYDGKTKDLPQNVLDMRVAYQFENISFQNAVSDVMKDFPLVCYPVKANVFCLTTPQAALGKRTLEFYFVGDLFAKPEAAKVFLDNMKQKIAPKSWRRAGGAGEMVFDIPSRSLIVLQSPGVQFQIYRFLNQYREQSRVGRGRKEVADE